MATLVPVQANEIEDAAVRLEGRSPAEALAWAAERFAPRVAFATGFGAEGCVIVDLIARHRLEIDVFTLDTGVLFPETYALWRRLEERYDLTIRAVRPAITLRRAGRAARRRALAARPRPLLRAAQGRAAAAGALGARRLGHRHPARADARARLGAGRRVGRALRPRQAEPPRRLDARGGVVVPDGAPRPRQPPARPRLPEHRLRAVHEPRAPRAKTRAPDAGAEPAKTECGLHSRTRGQAIPLRLAPPEGA